MQWTLLVVSCNICHTNALTNSTVNVLHAELYVIDYYLPPPTKLRG